MCFTNEWSEQMSAQNSLQQIYDTSSFNPFQNAENDFSQSQYGQAFDFDADYGLYVAWCAVSTDTPSSMALESPSRQDSGDSLCSISSRTSHFFKHDEQRPIYREPEQLVGDLSPLQPSCSSSTHVSFDACDNTTTWNELISDAELHDAGIDGFDPNNPYVWPNLPEHGILYGTPKCTLAVCCCGKEFTGQYALTNLQKHIRTENNLAKNGPFCCRVCGHRCNRHDQLRDHFARWHPDLFCSEFPDRPRRSTRRAASKASGSGSVCEFPLCGMRFNSEDELERHIKDRHPAEDGIASA